MPAPSVKCPNCGYRVPIPVGYPEEGEDKRAVCANCGVTLRLQRRQPSWQKQGSTTAELQAIRIPGYRLIGQLGRGGMASVISGIQVASGRLVAVKILPPSSAANLDLVTRFEREARMLASLTHPNVVQIIDRGQVGKLHYFVMEYIAGRTLKDRMEQEPLSLEEVVAILTRVGEAIQHCHEHGLVHRDLKPGNVLLTQSGGVKITDFGISGLLRRMGDITEQGVLIGTPQYVAPEQLRDGSRIDHRADQYSLGVLAYEMLTNSLPVGVFEPVSTRRDDIPKRTDDVLRKALARDPEDRFRSVREFIHEFRRAFQGVTLPMPAVAPNNAASADAAVKETPSPEASGEKTPGMDVEAMERVAQSLTEGQESESSASRTAGETRLTERPEPVPSASTRPQSPAPSAPSKPTTAIRVKGWWKRLEAPHRVAVIGVVILILVALVSLVERHLFSVSPHPVTAAGNEAEWKPWEDSAPLNPLDQEDELRGELQSQDAVALILAAEAGPVQWQGASKLFGSPEVRGLEGRLRFCLTDLNLSNHMTEWFRWDDRIRVVLSTQPRGGPRCATLVLAEPLTAQVVREAFRDLRPVLDQQLRELPPPSLEKHPNLLRDFGSAAGMNSEYGRWIALSSTGEIQPGSADYSWIHRGIPGTNQPYDFASIGGARRPGGIQQAFPVQEGHVYSTSLLARKGSGYHRDSWLLIQIVPGNAAEGPNQDPRSVTRNPPPRQNAPPPLWGFEIQATSDWHRCEVRWVAPETLSIGTVWIRLLSRGYPLDVRDIRVQELEP